MEIKEIKHQNEYHGSEMSICAKNKPKFQFFNVLTQWISWKAIEFTPNFFIDQYNSQYLEFFDEN